MFLNGMSGQRPGRKDTAIRPGHVPALRAYWEGLREADSLPARDRIDPRGLIGALSHVFLLERQAPGVVRLRLAGQVLCRLAGEDLRGAPLETLFDTPSRGRLSAQLEGVFETPSILEADLRVAPALFRPQAAGRMIVLPLLSAGGWPTLAIGCVDLPDDLGAHPRRLLLDRVLREPVNTGTLTDAPPPPAPPRGKPHLRLVSSR